MHRVLRIGVDVGGTNTDGVILDPTKASEPGKGIVAWHKAPTTTNPSLGISDALVFMFDQAEINPQDVASVTIGTTHFVNAVVERDAARLARVAVIRLCGPFSKHALPCLDWPTDMRELILGHYALVKGGLEVDGNLISDINADEIREQCEIIKGKGITSIVVNGVFSPIDNTHHQEEQTAQIISEALPGCHVVLSKEVANLGFLERENAAILNASILPFARKTIRSFQEPIKLLGLTCPVFLSQNDGTILSGEMASRLPIKTFSSGPTNSMRGAAYLAQGETKEAMMVVDIGGTTTDVGLLLANGFPRQAAAYSEFAGVRMNFSCPDVKSIGLGGGSIVRERNGETTVGPDSVGYKIQTEALVFGGNIATTTDYTVAGSENVDIGDRSKVKHLFETGISSFKAVTKAMLEKVVDTMKTSPEDLPVLLVGGGAVIAPDELQGASRVIKPEYSGVANAIGAAIARVSAVIDTVKSTETKNVALLVEEISREAIGKAVESGAAQDSVKIVEVETLPLPYIANKSRFIIRAAGEFDYTRANEMNSTTEDELSDDNNMNAYEKNGNKSQRNVNADNKHVIAEPVNITTYKPKVEDRVWYVSETDLDWMAIGCYILGTGGGGSPYSHMLRMRSLLRNGDIIRVINPHDLKDEDQVGCGGGAGSPTVGIEKLPGDEMMDAQHCLYEHCDRKATAMIALEIGGGNGLQGMILGASSNMNLPTVDGDWMGRAYPTKWQTTPVVFNERPCVFCPIATADGNGNLIYMPTATSDLAVERIIRAALSQMGKPILTNVSAFRSHVGCAEGPVTGAETKRWAVEHTISLAWRIGRAVAAARQSNRIDTVAESIIDEVGGPEAAKVIFKGKIVGVERTLRNGHVYGEVIIEAAADTSSTEFKGRIKIPFKNENIAAFKVNEHGSEEVLAIVPDLIAVIDAQSGEAIGTPEYRYGLLVTVIGITASDKWTSTPRAIEIGGPKAFGLTDIEYKPLGKFVKPISVIDEYSD
ncbi:DUF917-domain-containing protein [Aureobasidium subglaciale]|nr:DUF917-domain-containing protein [Aureobasidium subglaciale]KAI5231122.1 DUF917-domain-containing protein [Aureobasidium subglaciale]KAI5234200.1 DUF917-domain-containing protein [Aureobasidium subglaciale]KAI5267644.1 DUF917-domain-containing protein [Aureobasidium subglaciale]